MILIPNRDCCETCKHMKEEKKDGWIPCCDAFPEGVPDNYLFSKVDVTELGECANGIRYEADEELKKIFGID